MTPLEALAHEVLTKNGFHRCDMRRTWQSQYYVRDSGGYLGNVVGDLAEAGFDVNQSESGFGFDVNQSDFGNVGLPVINVVVSGGTDWAFWKLRSV